MTAEVTVGLVQVNNSFSNQNYLPLSVGMLQTYCQRYLRQPENYRFQVPVYRRIPINTAVNQLIGSDVVFFSAYVWNFRISLEIAKRLKAANPEVVIVFGGPHVPNRSESFLREYRFIDIASQGEGEQTAVQILENYSSRRWNVASISFIDKDDRFIQNPRVSRAKDLAVFPSPYLDGTFAGVMAANPSEQWIALWETNRGCPFSCTFCDWGSAIASKVYPFELERLYREVDWFVQNKIEFVFCCDANFGILSRDIDIAKRVADAKAASGFPRALSVQATKNATERAYTAQKILADAGLNKGIDIALQSIDPQTLKSIKRDNISTETYQELQRRFSRDNIETYTDLILGLPNETYDSLANAVEAIVENGQHNRIQFNNLSILPNAEMGDPEYQSKYGLQTIESQTINIHGSLVDAEDDVHETQMLVVASSSMPKPEWVRTRAFSWTAALLHFDKVLQIPLILVHDFADLGYRELIECFSENVSDRYPVLSSVRKFFLDKARDIQNGGPEYCLSSVSSEWLPIWWPADEYILIKLCFGNQLSMFYSEAQALLQDTLVAKGRTMPANLLDDAIRLNGSLLKTPFQTQDLQVEASYNIWEYYQAILKGRKIPLQKTATRYFVDRTTKQWTSWDDWCREVIWYGNKKGAYLYGNESIQPQLSGHF